MEEKMTKNLGLDDLTSVTGGRELTDMSLNELNALIKMYEKNLKTIYDSMGTEDKDEDIDEVEGPQPHNYIGGIAASLEVIQSIKAVRKQKFGV